MFPPTYPEELLSILVWAVVPLSRWELVQQPLPRCRLLVKDICS